MNITNLEHKGSRVDVSNLINILWENDGQTEDFFLQEIDGRPIQIQKRILGQMDEAWHFLKHRADGYSFNLTNNPALQTEVFNSESNIIQVSKNVDYRTIVSIRSQEAIYKQIDTNPRPNALVIVSMLISSDNKLVLGQRVFYGDWPVPTYESPGAFLTYQDLAEGSIVKAATQKVRGDFEENIPLKATPLVIYHFPRIFETVIVCIARIDKPASKLRAKKYLNIMAVDNTKEELTRVIGMPLNLFHPPSRTALQYYFDNFAHLSTKNLIY